jgi:hypothetical protein
MPGVTRVTRVMQELAGKLCHLSLSVYKILNGSSMFACTFDKIFLVLLKGCPPQGKMIPRRRFSVDKPAPKR